MKETAEIAALWYSQSPETSWEKVEEDLLYREQHTQGKEQTMQEKENTSQKKQSESATATIAGSTSSSTNHFILPANDLISKLPPVANSLDFCLCLGLPYPHSQENETDHRGNTASQETEVTAVWYSQSSENSWERVEEGLFCDKQYTQEDENKNEDKEKDNLEKQGHQEKGTGEPAEGTDVDWRPLFSLLIALPVVLGCICMRSAYI